MRQIRLNKIPISNGSLLTRNTALFILFTINLFLIEIPLKTSNNALQPTILYALSSSDSDTVINYYPMNVGDWRVFKFTYFDDPPLFEDTIFVFDTLLIEDNLYFTVGKDSLTPAKYHIDSLGNVYQLDSNGKTIVYPFGLFENDSFMTVDTVSGFTTLITVEERNVECGTGAGSFQNCIILYIDILEWIDEELLLTFAPDVGIVQRFNIWFNLSLYSAKIGTMYYGDIVSIRDDAFGILPSYLLGQNHPNPFNPRTTIEYSLPQSGNVSLLIYDLLGKEVERLVNKHQGSGYHSVTWDASEVPSGIYFYRLQAGDFVQTRKMVLLK